jgi:hypothetical protein
MQRKQLVLSKFGLNTARMSSSLPIRVIEVEATAPLGTNAFDEQIQFVCVAAKRAEQAELEQIFPNLSHGSEALAYAA